MIEAIADVKVETIASHERPANSLGLHHGADQDGLSTSGRAGSYKLGCRRSSSGMRRYLGNQWSWPADRR